MPERDNGLWKWAVGVLAGALVTGATMWFTSSNTVASNEARLNQLEFAVGKMTDVIERLSRTDAVVIERLRQIEKRHDREDSRVGG